MSSPLVGKLFDESGGPPDPQPCGEKERRYRYYVSRSLIAGTADDSEMDGGFRRPSLNAASPLRLLRFSMIALRSWLTSSSPVRIQVR